MSTPAEFYILYISQESLA